ncbi:MAG: dihydrofolate reductase family protein [Acidobacteriota bacterium]|nr:dihydrofolate reductase family protein [Acidobacteriota bacterium]
MTAADHEEWARARVRAILERGPERRVVAVLVTSSDGAAALRGRTAGLTSDADRALLRAWREVADALLVGTGTLTAELYSGTILGDRARARRIDRGRPALPPILTIDRGGALDVSVALRGEGPPPLIVYGARGSARGDSRVSWVELDEPTVERVVADARERLDARVLVAEGGPRLFRAALAEGVLSDLSLTVAPHAVGAGPYIWDSSGGPPRHRDLVPVERIDGFTFRHWALEPGGAAPEGGEPTG